MLKEVKGMKMKWTRGNNSSPYAALIFLSIFPFPSLLAQTPAANVVGLVLDPAGRPAAGAGVELQAAGGLKATGTTGSNGAVMAHY